MIFKETTQYYKETHGIIAWVWGCGGVGKNIRGYSIQMPSGDKIKKEYDYAIDWEILHSELVNKLKEITNEQV